MAISKDVILKQVVSNYMDSIFESDICREDEFSTSHRFDKKMSKLIKSRHSIYHKLTLTRARKIMCVAAIIIALLLASLSVESVRNLIAGFFVEHFSDHNIFSSSSEKNAEYPAELEKVYELGSVPQGYNLAYSNFLSNEADYIYMNKSKTLWFNQSTKDSFVLNHDNEFSKAITEEHFGQKFCVIYYNNKSEKCIQLMWDNGEYIFILSADLPKETLLDLYKTLKIKK